MCLASASSTAAMARSTADWLALPPSFSPTGPLRRSAATATRAGATPSGRCSKARDGRRMFAGFTTRIGRGGINGYAAGRRRDGSDRQGERLRRRRLRPLHRPGAEPATASSSSATASAPASDKRRVFSSRPTRDGLPLWERMHRRRRKRWGALYIEPAGDGGFIIAGGYRRRRRRRHVRDEGRRARGASCGASASARPTGTRSTMAWSSAPTAGSSSSATPIRAAREANDLVAATLTADGDAGPARAVRRRRRRSRDPRQGRRRRARSGSSAIRASAGAGGCDLLLASARRRAAPSPARGDARRAGRRQWHRGPAARRRLAAASPATAASSGSGGAGCVRRAICPPGAAAGHTRPSGGRVVLRQLAEVERVEQRAPRRLDRRGSARAPADRRWRSRRASGAR